MAAKKATPDKAIQRSVTDPEARTRKTNDGFHDADAGQAVVDEEAQVVLAVTVTEAGDVGQLFSLADRMADHLAAAGIAGDPEQMLADAGYCSADNLQHAHGSKHDSLIATGRLTHN